MLEFSISLLLSYQVIKRVSDPKSKIHNKFPTVKLKWIQLLPNLRIHFKGKIIHLHHWMYMSVILVVSIYVESGILASFLVKGFLAGGVFQGLTFPDWGKIIFSQESKLLQK